MGSRRVSLEKANVPTEFISPPPPPMDILILKDLAFQPEYPS